jgi:hypothetical protein
MIEKIKAFYNKNKPVVTKVVYVAIGSLVGVVAVLVVSALTYEPVDFDENLQKEYTTIDGETKIYNPFEDPATGLGDFPQA